MTTTTRFLVPAMDCPVEKELIAKRLRRVDGIEQLDFDLLDRVVTVRHGAGADGPIEAALADIGMQPQRLVDAARPTLAAHAGPGRLAPAAASRSRLGVSIRGVRLDAPAAAAPAVAVAPMPVSVPVPGPPWLRPAWLLAAGGVAALLAEILSATGLAESSWPVIALALVAMLLGGPRTYRKGLVALRTRSLDINLLMLIAVIGAVAIGQWPEAAMVTVLFALAELIEARSLERARDAIRGLMALTPETARVWRGQGFTEVPAKDVASGDLIQVRPGERVPLDGVILRGESALDQAPITGESTPVDKAPGAAVFAGSVNGQGALEIEVTAGQADTTLARIARTIRAAQSQKAPTERFVDTFARWYTPIVVVLALLVAVIPPLVLSGATFGPWIYKALVLLVIACPCALVISTPVTVVSGLARAARMGILVKGGVHLEGAARLRCVAVDKTGTLTEGKPSLVDVIPLGDTTRDELVQSAASLEASSDHPIAHAVVAAWSGPLLPLTEAWSFVGRGVVGLGHGGGLTIGSNRFIEERGRSGPDIERALDRLEAQGKSVLIVWSDARVLGVLAVADRVRATSAEAIRHLHGQGLAVAMLTGDNARTAAAVAAEVGIDEVLAGLLPEAKLAAVERLTREHGPVGMVGDGVNDAPAMARSALGFAMGAAGTDTALETADVALMQDDLRAVPDLIRLSRRTRRTLRVNIALAIGVKAVFFALALTSVATLWMAVLADMGASLLVAANGLRLLRAERGAP
ncbi:MAG: heavy metal translocating P-type ATPase [Myxococcota bacterium]